MKVQQEVDRCRDTQQILKWQEVVEDLWNVHFPYLKKELQGVGKYPFMEFRVFSGAEKVIYEQGTHIDQWELLYLVTFRPCNIVPSLRSGTTPHSLQVTIIRSLGLSV